MPTPAVPLGHVVSVYRSRYVPGLQALLQPALDSGWSAALWALDEPHPALAALTVGSGPGGKFDLVNEVLARRPVPAGRALVVADDDVSMGGGGLPGFLAEAVHASLDLAQPAHSRRSGASHRITRRRPLARARLTTFVEIGPVFSIAPDWLDEVVPFPAGHGMGWGLELAWRRLVARGCRLGVVDRVPVLHPETPNVTYSDRLDEEYQRLQRLLDAEGLPDLAAAQQVLGTWYRWQRTAPWAGTTAPRPTSSPC